MSRITTPLLSAILFLTLNCQPSRSNVSQWYHSIPNNTSFCLSGKISVVLNHYLFSESLAKYSLVSQSLDIFLKKARINPSTESGNISFLILGTPKFNAPGGLEEATKSFLLSFHSFNKPENLYSAMLEAFPQEGSLRINNKEFPIFVIFDYNQNHIRGICDDKGIIWIGDIYALTSLNSNNTKSNLELNEAFDWITVKPDICGIINPCFLAEYQTAIPGRTISGIFPKGIKYLTWGLKKHKSADSFTLLEIVIVGNPKDISEITTWIQRLFASAYTIQNLQTSNPDIIQERNRIKISSNFSDMQIKYLLSKLQSMK